MAVLNPNKYDTSASTRTGGYIYNAYLGTQFTNNTGAQIKVTSVEIYCKNGAGPTYVGYSGWCGKTLKVAELIRSNKVGIASTLGWQSFTFSSPLIVNNGESFYAGIQNQTGYQTTIYRYIGSTVGNAYYLASTSETSGEIKQNNTVMSTDGTNCTPYIRVNYEHTTTKCEPPKNLMISSNEVKNKGEVVLSWTAGAGGVNNAFTGYEVQQQFNTGKFYTIISNVQETNYPISFQGLSVGDKYTFRVRTCGTAGENYYSDYTSEVSCVVINTKPTMTSLKAENQKISTSGETVKFIWSSEDNDEQRLKYYYKLINNNSNNIIASGETYDLFTSIAVGEKDNKTFYVKAYDNYEYSNEISIQLQYNTKPKKPNIITVSGGYKNIANFSWESSDSNNDILTYSIERRIGENDDWKVLGSTSSTNYTDTSFPTIEYSGITIYYRVKANDGIEDSEYSDTYSCIRNMPPSIPTNFISSPNGTIVDECPLIAEDSILLSWNESFGSQSTRYYHIEMQTNNTNDFSNSAWVTLAEKVNGSKYIHSITNLTRGNYIKYRIRCIDDLGESSAYNTITQPIKRNTSPLVKALTSDSFSDGAIVDVWETNSATLNWEEMESDDGEGTYALIFNYDSKIFDIFGNKLISNIDDMIFEKKRAHKIDFVESESLSSFIKMIFGIEANAIFSDGYFELYTKDNFGVRGTTSKIRINFNTKYTPMLTLDKDYDYFKINGLSDNYIRASMTDEYYAMVNSGETVEFIIPAPVDKNLNETFRYKIKICESTVENKIDNPTFTRTIYESKNLEKPLNNFLTSYKYTVPNISTNIVVRYALEVIDSTGEAVSVIYPHGIEFCRYTEPSIEFKSIVAQNNKSLKGTYKVINNGGSSFDVNRKNANGLPITYDDRRNLERCNENGLYKIEIVPVDGSNIEILSDTNKYPHTFDEVEFTTAENTYNSITLSRNAYLKISIKNIKNNGEVDTSIIKSSNSNILMIYKIGAAALSGRPQGIGINIEPEARFQVAPQESDEVAIFGEVPSDNSANFPIIINLTTGRFVSAILDFGDYDE